jgi:hypothetical protein
MSGIDPAVRRQKIIQNLELLRAEFTAYDLPSNVSFERLPVEGDGE